jgi:FkbM family methyltransferase
MTVERLNHVANCNNAEANVALATGEPVLVPIAIGELADKMTILEIKSERIADAAKLRNVCSELDQLRSVWDRQGRCCAALDGLTRELKKVKETLWVIEDEIRDCERAQDFGPQFIALARAVYRTNDRRAEIKREINLLAGSNIIEEKSYRDYRSGAVEVPPGATITALKQCRHGLMLFLKRDTYVGQSLDNYGEWSESEVKLFSQFLKPGDVVAEIGSNIGAHTVPIAKLVGQKGLVLAFEPQPVIFQLLCANVALNGIFNVRTYHAAVGGAAGAITVPPVDYAVEGNFGGVSLGNCDAGEKVPLLKLDSLSLPALRLLKIDVEGMEAEVLSGAQQTIAKCRPILFVENERRTESAQLIELLDTFGYRMWWYTPLLFNPKNYANNEINVFGGTGSINLLCCPKEVPAEVTGLREVIGPADWWK